MPAIGGCCLRDALLPAMTGPQDKAVDRGCGEPWNLDALPDTELMIGNYVVNDTCQLFYDKQGIHKNNLYGGFGPSCIEWT